jgi:hypothetical protein
MDRSSRPEAYTTTGYRGSIPTFSDPGRRYGQMQLWSFQWVTTDTRKIYDPTVGA